MTHHQTPRIAATIASKANLAAIMLPSTTQRTLSSPKIPRSEDLFVTDEEIKIHLRFAKRCRLDFFGKGCPRSGWFGRQKIQFDPSWVNCRNHIPHICMNYFGNTVYTSKSSKTIYNHVSSGGFEWNVFHPQSLHKKNKSLGFMPGEGLDLVSQKHISPTSINIKHIYYIYTCI